MNKYFFMFAIGATLDSIFVILLFSMPSLVRYAIGREIRLIEGSPVMKQWGNVSIPIYVRFYFFDVQNADKVEFDGERPELIERGPYTFLQKRSKRIDAYLDNDRIVKYHEFKYFHFDAKRSVGSLSDMITVPNIPLMVIAHRATTDESEDAGVMFEVIQSVLKRLEPPMFENHTVGEMLFQGFHVELFAELADLLKNFQMEVPEKLAKATFGLMEKKNGSHNQEWQVQTGVDGSQAFVIHSWNGSKVLPYWKAKHCNKINGTDGSGFRPWIDKNDVLHVFDPDICRSARLVFGNSATIKNVPSFRFRLEDELFAPKTGKSGKIKYKGKVGDSCFCTRSINDSDICSQSGVFDMSACAEGAPLVLSQPHFLDADPKFIQNVKGMHPDRLKHETYLDVEPISGAVINAVRRAQFNIEVKKNEMPGFDQVPNMLLPIAWFEESVVIDDETAKQFRSLRRYIHGGENGIVLGIIVTTIFSFINFAYFINHKVKKITPAIKIKDTDN